MTTKRQEPQRLERLGVAGSFEAKLADGAAPDGSFSGYGSVFNEPHGTSSWMLDSDWMDVIEPGAFSETLALHKKRGTLPAMFLMHDMNALPIGAWRTVAEDDKGLAVSGQLALKVQRAADTYELMRIGGMRGISIGFRPTEVTLDEKAKTRAIHTVDLWEISPVPIPGDHLALVADVKAARAGIQSIRDFEGFLRDAGGFSRKEAKALAAKGFAAFAQRDADDDGLLQALHDLKKTISG